MSEAGQMRPQRVSVFELAGGPLCVASDDGQKVHDEIAGALRQGRAVELSFLHVQCLTAAFLNAAVGQLYGEFNQNDIKDKIRVSDMEQDDLALLKRVVDTAKLYFKDPRSFAKVVHSAGGSAAGSRPRSGREKKSALPSGELPARSAGEDDGQRS